MNHSLSRSDVIHYCIRGEKGYTHWAIVPTGASPCTRARWTLTATVNSGARSQVCGAHIARPDQLTGAREVSGSACKPADDDVLGMERASSSGAELAESTAKCNEVFSFRVGLL